ncbi:unnamed protein product, partial [Meganyctiphanes norvegica]
MSFSSKIFYKVVVLGHNKSVLYLAAHKGLTLGELVRAISYILLIITTAALSRTTPIAHYITDYNYCSTLKNHSHLPISLHPPPVLLEACFILLDTAARRLKNICTSVIEVHCLKNVCDTQVPAGRSLHLCIHATRLWSAKAANTCRDIRPTDKDVRLVLMRHVVVGVVVVRCEADLTFQNGRSNDGGTNMALLNYVSHYLFHIPCAIILLFIFRYFSYVIDIEQGSSEYWPFIFTVTVWSNDHTNHFGNELKYWDTIHTSCDGRDKLFLTDGHDVSAYVRGLRGIGSTHIQSSYQVKMAAEKLELLVAQLALENQKLKQDLTDSNAAQAANVDRIVNALGDIVQAPPNEAAVRAGPKGQPRDQWRPKAAKVSLAGPLKRGGGMADLFSISGISLYPFLNVKKNNVRHDLVRSTIPEINQLYERKQKISLRREIRASCILGIIMGVFIICWLPFFIVYVTAAFCPSCTISMKVMSFLTWLGYVNSSLNPVIYTIFNPEFRRALAKILRLKQCTKK